MCDRVACLASIPKETRELINRLSVDERLALASEFLRQGQTLQQCARCELSRPPSSVLLHLAPPETDPTPER